MRREELEQFVLHVGQIERTPAERGLVGLDVEHEGAVLEQFGASAFAGPPEQVLETRLELTRMERRQAEIVVKAGLDKGNLSRSLARWIEAGIVVRIGREQYPLHVYPLTRESLKHLAKER